MGCYIYRDIVHEVKKALEVFNSIPDWRQKSKITISIHDAMMSGFACMYFQDSSIVQFQKRMQEDRHRNNLNTLFGVENIPKETQMRGKRQSMYIL